MSSCVSQALRDWSFGSRAHELEASLKSKARLHVHCLEVVQVRERFHCAFERHAPKQIQFAQLAEVAECGWRVPPKPADMATFRYCREPCGRAANGSSVLAMASFLGKVDVHQLRTGA